MNKMWKLQITRKSLVMMTGVFVCAGASAVTAAPATAGLFKMPAAAPSNILTVEWQGGKPAKNSDWDKGGGYGGKPAGQGSSSNSSNGGWKSGNQNGGPAQTNRNWYKGWDKGSEKSWNGQGNSGNGGWKSGNQNGGPAQKPRRDGRAEQAIPSRIWQGADPCTVKFVPGSTTWNACKGIKTSGSAKK